MRKRSRATTMDKWAFGLGVVALILVAARIALAEPVSTVTDVGMLQSTEDTTYTGDVLITAEASCGEAIGIYYRIPDVVEDWLYAGFTYDHLIWTPPVWDRTYHFASQVTCDGVDELYPHDKPEPQQELEIYLSMEPPDTTVVHEASLLVCVQYLASEGFEMEADTPKLMWHWTHPTAGNPVVEYHAEWVTDESVSIITGIAVGDTTYAYWEAPYTVGQTQKLRVRGIDAFENLGLWSPWSDEWVDQGPPGSPPAPAGTLIMVD